MKIDRPNVKGPGEAYRSSTALPAVRKGGREGVPAPSSPDSVTVSKEAQEAVALRAQLKAAPEVRAEAIARIKAQLDAGTYQVDSGSLADRLLQARVMDE